MQSGRWTFCDMTSQLAFTNQLDLLYFIADFYYPAFPLCKAWMTDSGWPVRKLITYMCKCVTWNCLCCHDTVLWCAGRSRWVYYSDEKFGWSYDGSQIPPDWWGCVITIHCYNGLHHTVISQCMTFDLSALVFNLFSHKEWRLWSLMHGHRGIMVKWSRHSWWRGCGFNSAVSVSCNDTRPVIHTHLPLSKVGVHWYSSVYSVTMAPFGLRGCK